MTYIYLLLGSTLLFPLLVKFLVDLLTYIEKKLPPDLSEDDLKHQSQAGSFRQHAR